MTLPRRSPRAFLLALLAVGLWSTVATAFKLTLQHLDYVSLLFYASLTSTACLAAMLVLRGELRLALGVPRRMYFHSACLGALNPFLYYLILFKAYELLPAQEAQPLNYTWALTLTLLSVPLLKQRLTIKDVLGLAVGYVGVVIIATHGNPFALQFEQPAGVGLALVSTIIWALYWIYNVKDDRPPLQSIFLNFLFGLILASALFVFVGATLPSPTALAGAVYIGLFEMSITFVVWLSALKLTTNTARLSSLIFLSPFLSLIFISFFVGERILPSTFLGLSLTVAGIVIQRLRTARRGI